MPKLLHLFDFFVYIFNTVSTKAKPNMFDILVIFELF